MLDNPAGINSPQRVEEMERRDFTHEMMQSIRVVRRGVEAATPDRGAKWGETWSLLSTVYMWEMPVTTSELLVPKLEGVRSLNGRGSDGARWHSGRYEERVIPENGLKIKTFEVHRRTKDGKSTGSFNFLLATKTGYSEDQPVYLICNSTLGKNGPATETLNANLNELPVVPYSNAKESTQVQSEEVSKGNENVTQD
jgi:hypothetical protein